MVAKETTPARRLWRQLVEMPLKKWRRLGVVFVLAVGLVFGGLDTVDTAVTPFDPGKAFSDGQFTVTLDRASLVPEVRAGARTIAPAEAGRRYLGIVAELRNDGTVPGRLNGELDVRDLPDKRFIGAFRIADGAQRVALGPGLTEQLAFIWSLPEDVLAAGESVTVRVWKKKYTELMVTYGQSWVDSQTDYGVATLTVGAAS